MFWLFLSFVFCILIFRELTGHLPIYKPYLALLIILALLTAWPPYHHWRVERFLTQVAQTLAENTRARVHCNTLFDTLFDEEVRVMGHADPRTGYIVIQYPFCDTLMTYINQPLNPDNDALWSFSILTHESMHARGEYNEAKTECETVQRNYRTGLLLGIPDYIAKQNALDFYKNIYLKRTDSYFSKECVPGGALDEHLSDSTWDE
jgi:hypothetical protein